MDTTWKNTATSPITLFAVIGLGVVGMWLGEIWPGRAYWVPALCMGILRAYIVIIGPSIQGTDDLDPRYRKAERWSWASLVLFALYLGFMYGREGWANLSDPMHISLQCVNIMLMGAEYTFGQYQANRSQTNDERMLLEQLRNENESQRIENEKLRSENESKRKEIRAIRMDHELVQNETQTPIVITSNMKAIRCKHCKELVPFGVAAKQVTHCGEVIYQASLNGEPVPATTT